ncbi:hypothetical protein K490DRAFT_62109 [Saccharata proteae CBS 121410]|uniref:CFEM domain-containing protein n=1 Tax=Saccharata proteae CBS 121410 TaxID=1314787 RepID=A0A9P4I2Q0_9PEZI|nr:hypothetical protein K490DRAFT_62109 [Saccharata proteae CBS 121410]
MRSSTIALLLGSASMVFGQGQLLPKCAQACVGTSFGTCGQFDVGCICADAPLISNLACCVATGCEPADQSTVIEFAQNLCAGRGITDLPTTATTCSSTSTGPASTSATNTGAATTTGGSSAASSAVSSVSSAASSAAASVGSTASSSAGAVSTGAAHHNKGSILGMGIAAIGVLAVL